VARLIATFRRAADLDQKVQAVNAAAPAGEHRRLLGVELVARGLANFTISNPSLVKNVQLPEFENAGHMAWPPRKVPDGVYIAESVAQMVARMPSPTTDLRGYRAAQDAGRREEAEQHAGYYRRLNEQRQDEENTASIERAAEQEAMLRGE
jgi:hypothetical protein